MNNTNQETLEIIHEQMQKATEYVIRNEDRLTKQFGDKIIAVDYRDVRGGIVVDSDYNFPKLHERTIAYNYLVVGTIKEIIEDRKPVLIPSLSLAGAN